MEEKLKKADEAAKLIEQASDLLSESLVEMMCEVLSIKIEGELKDGLQAAISEGLMEEFTKVLDNREAITEKAKEYILAYCAKRIQALKP